jgi:hypothetical protein
MGVIGSGRLHFTAHSTLLRYERINGVRAAVIQTQATVPMDFTIDLSKLASRFGSSSSLGLPGLSTGTFRYSGSIVQTTRSWLDLEHRRLERLNTNGNIDVGFTIGGISVPGNPGEIRMAGTMNFLLDRLR